MKIEELTLMIKNILNQHPPIITQSKYYKQLQEIFDELPPNSIYPSNYNYLIQNSTTRAI